MFINLLEASQFAAYLIRPNQWKVTFERLCTRRPHFVEGRLPNASYLYNGLVLLPIFGLSTVGRCFLLLKSPGKRFVLLSVSLINLRESQEEGVTSRDAPKVDLKGVSSQ